MTDMYLVALIRLRRYEICLIPTLSADCFYFFVKKSEEKFAGKEKMPTFAIPNEKNGSS